MWSASNCSLLKALHYTFALLLVCYPNPNPDHLVFLQLGYISKCFHSFQHLATLSRMKHRLSKIYSNIASLSPRYIIMHLYICIYINFIYTQSLQIQNGIVMDWLYPSPVLEGPNCGIETGTTQEAIIQSSLSSPFLRPCYKDHTGKTKKRFTKLQALVNHLRSLIDASPFVWSI